MFLIIVTLISYIIDNTFDNDILTVVATDRGMRNSQFLTADGNAVGARSRRRF